MRASMHLPARNDVNTCNLLLKDCCLAGTQLGVSKITCWHLP